MAGMLPGVECARRRRFHQSGGSSDSPTTAAIGLTRRSSFCLYASNHETHHSSVSSQFHI
ncbi:E3 ubiquitin-protein ligase arkadia-like isoform 1 [Corchorus olitorius]|uniref:E3 ubiquitin-protein ligase arkadia-like isoform 1 n=1 Tax=Corchorus olitorius TaxID=93759 RepID=A0A1R3ICT9_9ROSI|nr:E3 ubiquitin-protein ligase arkadia-like isoform 1 [Corchorus olitorius]